MENQWGGSTLQALLAAWDRSLATAVVGSGVCVCVERLVCLITV